MKKKRCSCRQLSLAPFTAGDGRRFTVAGHYSFRLCAAHMKRLRRFAKPGLVAK